MGCGRAGSAFIHARNCRALRHDTQEAPTRHTQAHTVTNPSHIEPLVGQYFIVAANVKAAVLCLDPQQRGVGSNKQHQVAITLDREPLRSTRTHAHHTTRCKRQAT